jgi:RimJ/RimL family protein N-acetyltransferase
MVVRLTDGTRVVIRPIRPSDAGRIARSRGRFSDESMRSRFLAPKPHLTNAELRYLTDVDGEDHYALVASRLDDLDSIVATARWVRQADEPTSAEAAIIVADDHQGKGLGRRLAYELADAGHERGIRRFTATMLPENHAALALMRALSQRLESRYEGGLREVVTNLAA